jgi:hypothetical protein
MEERVTDLLHQCLESVRGLPHHKEIVNSARQAVYTFKVEPIPQFDATASDRIELYPLDFLREISEVGVSHGMNLVKIEVRGYFYTFYCQSLGNSLGALERLLRVIESHMVR